MRSLPVPARTATALAIVAILCLAGWLRLHRLAHRPLHTDEAVHAVKFDRFLQGRYRYDPREYHGPTLYWATLPSWLAWGRPGLAGQEAPMLRLATALAGLALVATLAAAGRALGRNALLWAILFAALSPAFVFYSRYYIQEMLLAWFSLVLALSWWRWCRAPSWPLAVSTGIAAGLVYSTKETGVIVFAALGVATLAGLRGPDDKPHVPPRRGAQLLVLVLLAILVAAAVLSNLGANLSGPLDSLRAYTTYLDRGTGGEGVHNHSWSFYFHLLLWFREGGGPLWTEGLIVILALAGSLATLVGRLPAAVDIRFARATLAYGGLLTLVYTLIPYKTPWCLLGFWSAGLVLAGIGAALLTSLVARPGWRLLPVLLLLVGAAHLGQQAWRAAFRFNTDPRNPWVYAQTVRDTERLAQRVVELATLVGSDTPIQVIAGESGYWPLPWYLRHLNQGRIGWYADAPAEFTGQIVVAGGDLAATIEERLPGWHSSIFGLRPGVHLHLWVHPVLWNLFIDGRRLGPGPRISHRAMATGFQVTFAGIDGKYARQAGREAFALLDRIEGELSRHRPNSALSRLNNLAPGTSLDLGEHLHICLLRAREVHRLTAGAFDPSILPLMQALAGGSKAQADPAGLARARALVGMDQVEIDPTRPRARVRRRGVALDLGGIGKGYALDRMAELLGEWQVKAALLHGGHSSVLALAPPPGRPGWPLAIPDPRDRSRILHRLHLAYRAAGASGIGTKGLHIIDPATGEPVRKRLAAWALASTATRADALSTAFMVMPAAAVEKLCREHPEIAALLVDRRGADGIEVSRYGSW